MAEAVAVAVTGQILAGIAKKIGEMLGSNAFEGIGSIRAVKDEFQKLKGTLSTIEAVLKDAEKKQDMNHQLRDWLTKLRDAVYDADDLLADFVTEDLRRRTMGEMEKKVRTFQFIAFSFEMAKKIKVMRERFDAIAKDRNNFQLVDQGPSETVTRDRDQTSSHIHEEEIFGREKDKEILVDLLLDSKVEENVSFLSIVGIGGMGKTTLARYVYNDTRVLGYFDLKMWVCVSDNFDVKKITENIIESATGKKHEYLEMNNLQNKLCEELNQKKYLLVLDDVWNENEEEWWKLKIILKSGSKGSKVVITTRTKLVAEITSTISPYYLQGLSKNQSRSLFKQMAFRKEEEMINPNLEEIGMDIVQKCYGVPLVIKVIGRILYIKKTRDEWLYIKNKVLTNVTQEENNIGILPNLKLSYDHLPSHLKCCFAYCSLFPKDQEISKLTLINLWIAQGFIKSSNGNLHMEDVANEYCMDLLWRSFFQEAREDSFGNIISFKMHDLIHDLAQSISRVECTYIDSNIENVNKNVRHLSVASIGVLKKDLSSLFEAKKIRTFILSTDLGEEESSCQKSTLGMLFCSLRCLRALDLHDSNITAVPNSIENLTYLKYLDLSWNTFEVLPSSIVRLLNLQTLNLNYCEELKELPGNIQNLFNLRNLELKGCCSLTHMPPGLGQLTSLQVLPLFIVNEELTCAGLPELNNLNNLREELSIRIKVRVKDATSKAKDANLKDKQHLRKLELKWDDELGNDVAGVCEDENLMEGLRPHQNLKLLNVRGYKGVRFPSWLPSLTGLVILGISNSMCQHLSPMYRLPYLRNLSLEDMYGLEYISDREITEEISASSTFFPSLESLKLRNCGNLKGWWRRDTVGVATSSHQYQPHVSLPSFPRLLQLEIRGCENLTCMPLFPNLEELLQLNFTSCNPLQQTMNLTAISSVPSASNSSLPLSKLKFLSLSCIEDLEFLAEQWLQNLASLEKLEIEGCNRLKSLSLSLCMQHLTSLKTLSIRDCEEVDLFSDEDAQSVGVSPLQRLTISNVPRLVTLPLWIGNHTSHLEISNCPNLKSISEGIGNLTALENLEISNCPNLKSISKGIGNLTALENLEISNCPILKSISKGRDNLTALQNLEISNCPNLKSISEGIGNLTALENLEISNCLNLKSISEGRDNLTALENLEISNCPNLKSIAEGRDNLTALENLEISNCPNLESLSEGIGNLTALQNLEISNYPNLKSLPERIGNLTALQNLEISNCPNLKSLSEGISNLTALQNLEISNCLNLKSLPDVISNLTALQNLKISNCPNLKSLSEGIGNLTALQNLEISNCPNLKSLLKGIGNLTALQNLKIFDCPNLKSLPEGIGNLTELQNLKIFYLPSLISLPEWIGSLTSLKRFEVHSCRNLTSLPSGMHRLSSLRTLKISDCPHLKERYQKGNGEIAHVPNFQYRNS